jgi:hypothetical protein
MAREALRSAIHAGREAGIGDRELMQMLRDEMKPELTESTAEPIRGSAP